MDCSHSAAAGGGAGDDGSGGGGNASGHERIGGCSGIGDFYSENQYSSDFPDPPSSDDPEYVPYKTRASAKARTPSKTRVSAEARTQFNTGASAKARTPCKTLASSKACSSSKNRAPNKSQLPDTVSLSMPHQQVPTTAPPMPVQRPNPDNASSSLGSNASYQITSVVPEKEKIICNTEDEFFYRLRAKISNADAHEKVHICLQLYSLEIVNRKELLQLLVDYVPGPINWIDEYLKNHNNKELDLSKFEQITPIPSEGGSSSGLERGPKKTRRENEDKDPNEPKN